MDILAIVPSTVTVSLKHPTTARPVGISLEIVSLDDDRVKQVERVIRNKALKAGRNNVTAEKLESHEMEILAASIVGWTWDGDVSLGDLKNPPLNRANVIKLLSLNWVKKQVDEALGDVGAFFQESATI